MRLAKGKAIITFKATVDVEATYNNNYKTGKQELLKDCAVTDLFDQIPKRYDTEIVDVVIEDYEESEIKESNE